ncbi:MAG: gliding motility-associated-like protein [Maribacter sp.]|jgi:gliding motility-associated-like protein
MSKLRTLILLFLITLLPVLVMTQTPDAEFLAEIPTPPCVPLTIPFSNTSSNAISYNWTINGNFFSDEENPERIFTVEGTYDICLEVTGTNGSDTYCETIELYTGPDLDFVATTSTQGCAPLEVTFLAESDDSDITNLTWDFGDGTIINTSNLTVTHTYNTSSIYDVSLTATNANGCNTSISQEDVVNIFSDVTPQFTADNINSCEAPLSVNFNNISTGNLANVSYAWDFGDNNTSTLENPSHTYNTPDNYDVSLTITNNDTGCSNTTIIPSFINIGATPMFSFTTNNNGSCNQITATFANETTSNVVIYFWDFGDGTSSNLENPVHTYSADGCHYPSLTVTTTDGCIVIYESPDCINIIGSIDLSYTTSQSITACEAPLIVDFSTAYNGSLMWDFGGAGTSTAQNPTFTFTEEGTYPVTLTAILANGCEQSVTTTTIYIIPPSATFEADTLEGCAPLLVNFSDISNVSGTITSWAWDLGDGTTSSLQNPSHTYTEHGSYDVSLTITLDNGCEGTSTWFNYIQAGYIPSVNFEGAPTETCIENIVAFTDLSNDENIDYWLWDFGDGGFSPDQDPLHEYNDTGWFDVKLIVGYNNCYDSLLIEDYMHLFPPKAVFSTQQDCSNPGAVTFTDASIGADTWDWDFGDGTTSTEQNPTHFYTENGIYTVTLEVYNGESGCTDEVSAGVYVQAPMASFVVNPSDACYTGSSIFLEVTNTSDGAVSYDWYAPGIFVIFDNAEDEDPTFKFNSPGQYTGMQLTAIDGAGCESVFIYEDTITISEINSIFTFENIDEDCNQIFQFTDASTSSFSDIVSWEWNFGDGFTSTEQNPIHVYGQGGFYLPSLKVTNSIGCFRTRSYPNPLQVEVPYVFYNTDTLICLDDLSIFTNASIASEFIEWEWDFGNGDTSTDWNPQYTYPAAGTYMACFSATNSDGCIGMHCRNIIVEQITADFTADFTSASCSPLVVQFTDLSTNIIAWEWDFGDNSGLSSLQNPAHTYNMGGSFDVCVTATSISGCTETICQENFIQIGGPTAEVNYNPGANGCLDYEVTFEINGTDIDTYTFDFGDGTTTSDAPNSNNFNVSHTYTSVGEFTPVLLLGNEAGCQNFITLEPIATATLEIDATSSDNNFCAGTAIDFNSIINTTSNIQTIEWFFEGANTSTSNIENPTGIIYSNAGNFDVSLTITTQHCSEVTTLENYINVLPQPQLSFIASPSVNCGATAIYFINNSTLSGGTITSWSWNFGNGLTSSLESPMSNYDSVGIYEVSLIAESDEGCIAEITQTVTILEEAIANVLMDGYVLCQGQNIELASETNGTTSWSPSTGLSCTNCTNPIANPSVTTMYYLTNTTPNGCIATDSILIERIDLAPPTITLSNDTTICGGDIIQIIASGGSSPFHYRWDDSVAGLSCYQNCTNPLVDIHQTTTFTVFVSNEEGCISSKSVTVTVIGSDLDLLGNDRTICLGDSIVLNTSAGFNPTWESDASLSCLDCENPVATPLETTTYTVIVDYQECIVTRDITINVIYPDEVDAGVDALICVGQSILLEGVAEGDISWSNNGNIFETENLNPAVNPVDNTNYVLTAINDLCTLSDTVNIEVTDKLELEVNDIGICEPGAVQLNASGSGITDFNWSPSENIGINNIPNPVAIVNETTTFTVIGSNGTCESDTAIVNVLISDGPEIILPSQQAFFTGIPVSLIPKAEGNNGICTYSWSPNINISCTDCENPIVSPDSTTTYTLIVTNELGCSTMSTITLIPMEDCLEDIVIVPTGFSPNGDGKNDELRALGLAEINLFRVFNRWGELMFETNNPSEGWNGTFKGKEVNTDVYVWYLEAICPIDGSVVSKKGDATLIR